MELQRAFDRGGRKAIDKVMKSQPALFLKMLVLLVPREMEVTHSSAIKQMTDEQIDACIEAIEGMLAQRAAGDGAKVIEHQAEPSTPRRTRRKASKPDPAVGADVGTDANAPISPMISNEGGG
jgi:hypothetical protein